MKIFCNSNRRFESLKACQAIPSLTQSKAYKPDTYKGIYFPVLSVFLTFGFWHLQPTLTSVGREGNYSFLFPCFKQVFGLQALLRSIWLIDWLDNAISIYYITLSMQKAYLFSIYPLFYMSILAAIKIIFLFTDNFLNMNNHLENIEGAEIRLFWGFSHLHSHRESGFSSSIIHNENAFIVRILRL